MKEFNILKKGYRGRLVADKATGLIGQIVDKYYSGLYEVWFERTDLEQELILQFADVNQHVAEFPNKKFMKADQLEILD